MRDPDNDSLASRILEAIPECVRGGLYVRGGEPFTLNNTEWDSRPFRILIARLSSYADTSLSFTHNLLYSLFASKGWFPDFAFLPAVRDRSVFAARNIPWLFGIESRRGARAFGVIAFSNSVAQETVNLFPMLERSGLPVSKAARMADESVPLVLLGGANASSSCVLFHPDPPVDGIFAGEDLDAIARLFAIAAEGRERGLSKRAVLESLREVPGFIEPDRSEATAKLNRSSRIPLSLYGGMPVNFADGNAGKAVFPISEGCAGFCSFCNESFVRKPYREEGAPELLAAALELKTASGSHRADLFSFNFNMHKDFYPLIEGLAPLFGEIALKSQRFDSIAEDPALIEIEKTLGKSVFTCGLEGISERIRRFLNKNLDDAQVFRSLEVLVKAQVREIKVFLIATGREEELDYLAWSDFLSRVKMLKTPQGRPVRTVFSVTPLVRFPHTPLEFEPLPPLERTRTAAQTIASIAEKAGFECRLAASPEESAFSDAVLRAKSPHVLDALREAAAKTGFVYDREITVPFWKAFLAALKERGVDPFNPEVPFSPGANANAPWKRIDAGVSRKYLAEQYERNASGREIQPDPAVLCGKGRAKIGPAAVARICAAIAASGRETVSVPVRCSLSSRWSGLPREYPAQAAARALMQAAPVLAPLYRGFTGSFWQAATDEPVPLHGLDILRFSFRLPASGGALNAAVLSALEGANRLLEADGIVLSGIADKPDSLECAVRIESSSPVDPDWLLQNGLKYVYRKDSGRPGSFVFDFTPAALKKNVFASLSQTKSEEGSITVTVVPGAKFSIAEFLLRGFGRQGPGSRVSAEAVPLSVEGGTHVPRAS